MRKLTVDPMEDPYQSLQDVLDEAHMQAANGKGSERHGNGLAFEDQPMQTISQLIGSPDGLIFQAIKKAQESQRLPTTERRVAELLGSIVYLAGAIIYIRSNSD